MIYLKWKLSDGTTGTGPESFIHDAGGNAAASWAVDASGYRIGYASTRAPHLEQNQPATQVMLFGQQPVCIIRSLLSEIDDPLKKIVIR